MTLQVLIWKCFAGEPGPGAYEETQEWELRQQAAARPVNAFQCVIEAVTVKRGILSTLLGSGDPTPWARDPSQALRTGTGGILELALKDLPAPELIRWLARLTEAASEHRLAVHMPSAGICWLPWGTWLVAPQLPATVVASAIAWNRWSTICAQMSGPTQLPRTMEQLVARVRNDVQPILVAGGFQLTGESTWCASRGGVLATPDEANFGELEWAADGPIGKVGLSLTLRREETYSGLFEGYRPMISVSIDSPQVMATMAAAGLPHRNAIVRTPGWKLMPHLGEIAPLIYSPQTLLNAARFMSESILPFVRRIDSLPALDAWANASPSPMESESSSRILLRLAIARLAGNPRFEAIWEAAGPYYQSEWTHEIVGVLRGLRPAA